MEIFTFKMLFSCANCGTFVWLLKDEFVNFICRQYLRDTIKIGVGKLICLNWGMLFMALVMQSHLLFLKFWSPNMMMEVAERLNSTLTVLLSKFSHSKIFWYCIGFEGMLNLIIFLYFRVCLADAVWLLRWDHTFELLLFFFSLFHWITFVPSAPL